MNDQQKKKCRNRQRSFVREIHSHDSEKKTKLLNAIYKMEAYSFFLFYTQKKN